MTGTSTSADWSRLTADLLTELRSTSDGLSTTESRERTDAAIVIASAVLSFAQEYTASNASEKLRTQVTIKATMVRDGTPGDV